MAFPFGLTGMSLNAVLGCPTCRHSGTGAAFEDRCLEARCEFRALFFKLWSVRGKCACGFRAALCLAADCSCLTAGRSGPRNLTAVFVRLHYRSSQLKIPWKKHFLLNLNLTPVSAWHGGRKEVRIPYIGAAGKSSIWLRLVVMVRSRDEKNKLSTSQPKPVLWLCKWPPGNFGKPETKIFEFDLRAVTH